MSFKQGQRDEFVRGAVKKSFSIKMMLAGGCALLATLFVQGGTAFAQACDPQFMDAMEARGFVEAARENVQNQNLIYKPDGVFEYSCFRLHVPEVQKNVADLFRLNSLTTVTTDPIKKYTETNYGTEYLNTRVNEPAIEPADPPADMCNALAVVWDIARCINFYNREDLEGLFDLTHYTTNDPRKLPASLPACAARPFAGLNMALDIAYNNKRSVWTMGPYARDEKGYFMDPVDLQKEMYEPAECGTAIPTGMVVTDRNAAVPRFNEKTCSNPACVYVPSSEDAGECTMPN